MNKSKNITFFLGAGASRYACPIWKEQGQKMLNLARICLGDSVKKFDTLANDFNDEYMSLAWEIGYFGTKALEYGTIDTYAKRLFLNESHDELAKLKLAVSVFFTTWQMSEDRELKSFDNFYFQPIDKRYFSLMASVLERSLSGIRIKENIKFVSWNYDLQIEHTFKSFQSDSCSWDRIQDLLKFSLTEDKGDRLEICHLNGYHGFYESQGKREVRFLGRTDSMKPEEIVKDLSHLSKGHDRWQLSLRNHINYAWESNEYADRIREESKKIFAETDILVIIGYSFPNFNKEIDKELFASLNTQCSKIYYQDPNASESFIEQLVDKNRHDIICQNDKLDYFLLPYEF